MNANLAVEWVLITPELARKYLEFNTHNRNKSPFRIKTYAKDMKEGRWLQTHQGIAFAIDGTLIDGQNRLYAIIEANVPVVMMVTRGLPLPVQIVVDDHKIRSKPDSLKLSGFSSINHTHVAIANVMMFAPRFVADSSTKQEMQQFMSEYFEQVDFAYRIFPSNRAGITQSAVRGILGRASFSRNHDELTRFARILAEGVSDDDQRPCDRSVITFRNLLIQPNRATGGGTMRREIYRKGQRALLAYLEGEILTKCYECMDDLFPLPENAA